jgi:AcrR family transcriptional regulator
MSTSTSTSTSTAPSPAAEATRARIADAAERLFRTMGYQKTAVADIARDLGMSPANVYRFFPSKSAINEAITERLLTGIADAVEAIARRDASAEERLTAIAEAFRAASLRLFFDERRMHDMVGAAMTEHWGVIERYLLRFLGALEAVVRDGMARGEFAPGDAAAAAVAIKQATLAWHHPLMVEECMRMGRSPEQAEADLRVTLGLMIAGLKRGVR